MVDGVFSRLVCSFPGEGAMPQFSNVPTRLPELGPTEVLARVEAVPLHGSFWMAVHPTLRHPRHRELVERGGFVFGNGGLAQVVRSGSMSGVFPGTWVAVHGHFPCSQPECQACRVHGRFVECRNGGSGILGHGRGAPDGLLADLAVLPAGAFEPITPLGVHEAMSATLSFLVGDVRNALLRGTNPEEPPTSILILGAGLSGTLAAALASQMWPQARVLVVDGREASLARLRRLPWVGTPPAAAHLHIDQANPDPGRRALAVLLRAHIDGLPNLIFDTIDGAASAVWAAPEIVSHGTSCVCFGFHREAMNLSPAVLQCAGLRVFAPRGVGDLRNVKASVAWCLGAGRSFVAALLSTFEQVQSIEALANMLTDCGGRRPETDILFRPAAPTGEAG